MWAVRPLTREEQQQLERARDRLPQIQAEFWPMLSDLFGKLGLNPPPRDVRAATWYLPAFEQWISAQTISPNDAPWITARVAGFLGELLVERWQGTWYVNDLPDTHFFARIVVGRFPGIANPHAMVDPYSAALSFVSSPPGRSLTRILSEIERDLKQLSQ